MDQETSEDLQHQLYILDGKIDAVPPCWACWHRADQT